MSFKSVKIHFSSKFILLLKLNYTAARKRVMGHSVCGPNTPKLQNIPRQNSPRKNSPVKADKIVLDKIVPNKFCKYNCKLKQKTIVKFIKKQLTKKYSMS